MKKEYKDFSTLEKHCDFFNHVIFPMFVFGFLLSAVSMIMETLK